jgi:hypothetical protein
MSDIYDVSQLVGKTLFAKLDVPIYDAVPDVYGWPAQKGTIRAGAPVGVVYGWVDADPTENRPTLWWMFENGGQFYYAPHARGYYDLTTLRDQGVLTDEELQALEEEKNKEWWEKALGMILPAAVITVLGAAAIRGYLSRK